MKPMLAHKYNDHIKKVKFPCYVQPKLNGVRALYRGGTFQSRDEVCWATPTLLHIHYALRRFPPQLILDGELYTHGWSLQKINGAASVNRVEPRPDTIMVEYHIFDCLNTEQPDLSFAARHLFLQEAFKDVHHTSPAKLVKTLLCKSKRGLESAFGKFVSEGYEGLMYRDADAPYGLSRNCGNKENRWPCLLKRKDWLDEWFNVIDYELGNGKFEGMVGALVCETPEGLRFNVGGGLSDLQRKQFLELPPKQIHVKYEMLSEAGIPLKPTFLE